MATAEATQAIERRTIAKVSWRLLPLVALAYCIAYIDRSNISFAALTMNKDLGFSAYIYGWGAGIFFFGYFLFEIPSNLILERAGARLWIARIMITWGIISGLTAFVTGPTSFLVIRFLLGRVLPRHDPVFHLLVPAGISRPGDIDLVHRAAGGQCAGLDHFGRDSRHGWCART
jgi:MFS family permease